MKQSVQKTLWRGGLDWAKSHGGTLIGLAVIDVERLTKGEPVPLGGMAYKEELDRARLDHARQVQRDLLELFQQRAAAAQVGTTTLACEGDLAETIAREAQRSDAVLVDQPDSVEAEVGGLTMLQFADMVKHCPCPVVVVPEIPPGPFHVLVAYDGSAQSAHALMALAQSGLMTGRKVRIVGVGSNRDQVTRSNERAIEFLASHGLTATAEVIEQEDAAEALRLELVANPATLLVMGAYGQRTWREFLFGSVTRTMLQMCPGPILLTH